MFWHLKNRIKEETGNDVDLIPSIVNYNQPRLSKEKNSLRGSTSSLGSFTIDNNKEDATSGSSFDMKLADGKVITPKEFKKLESKEDEWRRKLQKKEDELAAKLKKMEDTWKKQLNEKEKEMKEELEKKETEKQILEEERNELKLKNSKLEESSMRASEYQKKICQYQEDMDQMQGFQMQEMAKIKHLFLVKEQELAEKEQLLKESNAQVKSLKLEVARLRNFEQQFENVQDDLERMRHGFDLERSQLTSKLAEKEEDVRHLKDKVALLEERANSGPVGEMTVDERVQKLLGERALFERRLEETHLHLSQIKSSWSSKIESLETQVGRLCRQASEESSEKRLAEMERDSLKAKLSQLEADLEEIKSKSESKDRKLEKLFLEKTNLEEVIKNLKIKNEEDVQCLEEKIKSMTENSHHLEEKLNEKSQESEGREESIKGLKSKLSEEAETRKSLEFKLNKLNEEFEAEKKLLSEINCSLERERLEKDEMMMRNAQISLEVDLAKQELRKQELESNELHSRIVELEKNLKEKQKELDRAMSDKLELNAKMERYENIERDQESSSSLEKDLKAKVVQLENELFDKNKNLKVLQQRLTDMKKTLQKELKVSATPSDPGGPDSDNYISCSAASSSSTLAPLNPATTHHQSPSPKFRGEETFEDGPCDDVNFKYLKHVLMKFLTSRECEAQHLTRAVATLLRFSAEEEKLLRETLEWKMSWFGTRPNLGNGQTAKTIPPR